MNAEIIDSGERLYVVPIAVSYDRSKCKLFAIQASEFHFFDNWYMPLYKDNIFIDNKWLKVKAHIFRIYKNISTYLYLYFKEGFKFYRDHDIVYCIDVFPETLGIDRTFFLKGDFDEGYLTPNAKLTKAWLHNWILRRSMDERYKEYRYLYIEQIQKYCEWLEKNKDYEIHYLISLDT